MTTGKASLQSSQTPVCWCGREMQPKADQPTVFATLWRCPDEDEHNLIAKMRRYGIKDPQKYIVKKIPLPYLIDIDIIFEEEMQERWDFWNSLLDNGVYTSDEVYQGA